MRKKVNEEIKRNTIIGIKVDKATKAKIDYIAEYNGEPTSKEIRKPIMGTTEEPKIKIP